MWWITSANQLTDMEEPVSEQVIICKVMRSLPSNFRYLTSPWDSVSRDQQTVEALTLRLLKEEGRNRTDRNADEDGDKAFFIRGASRGAHSIFITNWARNDESYFILQTWRHAGPDINPKPDL